MTQSGKHARILALVRMIPPGRVASYGQIAGYLPGVTPRLVGFAMAGSAGADIPWHRVLNAKGGISGHAAGAEQRRLLEAEGVHFDASERIDWAATGWSGPDPLTLMEMGIDPEIAFTHGGVSESSSLRECDRAGCARPSGRGSRTTSRSRRRRRAPASS